MMIKMIFFKPKINKIYTKNYMIKKTHKLPPLQVGDAVRIQPHKIGQRKWILGEVIEEISNRKYKVKTSQGG